VLQLTRALVVASSSHARSRDAAERTRLIYLSIIFRDSFLSEAADESYAPTTMNNGTT
jgi:hypothetical protein